MLSNLLPSNEAQIRRAVEMVTAHNKRKIGIFGLSFKSGTDDLRESPLVELAERLTGKGYELQIFDANVAHSRLIGANKAFLDERMPHISPVLTDDADAVLAASDVDGRGLRLGRVQRGAQGHVYAADQAIIDPRAASAGARRSPPPTTEYAGDRGACQEHKRAAAGRVLVLAPDVPATSRSARVRPACSGSCAASCPGIMSFSFSRAARPGSGTKHSWATQQDRVCSRGSISCQTRRLPVG